MAATGLALAATTAHASHRHEAPVGAAHAVHAASETEMDWLRTVFIADRLVGYLAVAVLGGGWLFLAVVWPAGAGVRRARLALAVAWVAGFAATGAGLGLQGATVARSGFAAVVDPSVVGDVLDTDFGRAWAARALLYVLALPLLGALARDAEHAARATWWRAGAFAVAAGLVRTLGLVGHSTETDESTLGAVADFVHVAAAAAWFGGLVLLATVVLPRRRPDELAAVVPRFSTLAQVAIGTVIAAGVVLAWIVVGGFAGLLDTHYGRMLLLKLVVLAAVLVAALCSRRWVRSGLRLAGDESQSPGSLSVRPFVVSVAAEVALAVALLWVASVLVSTSPAT